MKLRFKTTGPTVDVEATPQSDGAMLLTVDTKALVEKEHALAARFAEAVDAALDCTDAEPAHPCVTCRAQLRSVLAEYAAASGKTGGGSET